MSFRDIRASRASRNQKSFVRPSPTPEKIPRENLQSEENGSSSPENVQEEASPMAVSYIPDEPEGVAVPFPPGCYAELPPFLSIKHTSARGRGLWTNAALPVGTVICSVKPHVHALSRSQLDLYCSSCCAPQPSSGLKRCTKCKTVSYCGTTCQNIDWQMHKSECETLQKWALSAPMDTESAKYSVPPEAVRCVARIIWRRKKLGSDSIWWKEVSEMHSTRDSIPQSMVETHFHLAHAIMRLMGIPGPKELQEHGVPSIGSLVDLISKFTLNSFSLTTPSLSPIGVTVSPLAALLNHSCDPNVAVVFPRSSKQEPDLQIVAIQDIPANSELFTSYIDITLPTIERNKDLKETYDFVCGCLICDPPPGKVTEDWRERMWCPNACGASCPIPSGGDDVVRCRKCLSSKDSADILDLMRVGREALNKAPGLQTSDPAAALQLVQKTVLLLGSHLPPSAHPLLALIRLGQGLVIAELAKNSAQAPLDTAVQFAMAYVKGLSSILRPGHPVRAVAIAELGKLLAVDEPATSAETTSSPGSSTDTLPPGVTKSGLELQVPKGPARLQRAVEVLRQAYLELCLAFGRKNEGGEVGRSVREMLATLERELGVWRSGIRDTLEDTLAERKGKTVSTH